MKVNLDELDRLIDEATKGRQEPIDEASATELMKQMMKRICERALRGELTHHLGYEKNSAAGNGSGNSRNGTSAKTIKGDLGQVVIEVPRDRNGEFEPQLIGKHQTRFKGFDEKMISMYARGMSTREG